MSADASMRSTGSAPVEVGAVSVVYGRDRKVVAVVAVDEASLTVGAGELVAILGSSGSGKTSLLRALAGFVRPGGGTISVGSTVMSRAAAGASEVFVPPHRRRIGIVPQEGALFPHLDVAGNVGFGLNRLDRDERRRRVAELIELVELDGLERRHPHQLSGGQQQRVALARAIAPRPDVILLDEPFSALDTELRLALRAEVAALLRHVGTTAVLVTHDAGEAMSMADRIAVMQTGRIVQTGAPRQLYLRPTSRHVARLLGGVNVIAATATGSAATCALGTVALTAPADGRVELLVRPEQLRITTVESAGDPSGAWAIVLERHFEGADETITVRWGDQTLVARMPLGRPGPGAIDVAADVGFEVTVGDTVAVRVAGPVVAVAPTPR